LLTDLHAYSEFFATEPMEQLLVALQKIWHTAKIMMKMKKFKQAAEFLRSVNYAR
jgi:hypothetical protein